MHSQPQVRSTLLTAGRAGERGLCVFACVCRQQAVVNMVGNNAAHCLDPASSAHPAASTVGRPRPLAVTSVRQGFIDLDQLLLFGTHSMSLRPDKVLEPTGKLHRCLNLGSYNYLGFAAQDEYCTPRVLDTLHEWGVSTCSSRVEAGELLREFQYYFTPPCRSQHSHRLLNRMRMCTSRQKKHSAVDGSTCIGDTAAGCLHRAFRKSYMTC